MLTFSWHHRLVLSAFFFVPLSPFDKSVRLINNTHTEGLKKLHALLFIEEYLKAIKRWIQHHIHPYQNTFYGYFLSWVFKTLMQRLQYNRSRIKVLKREICQSLYIEAKMPHCGVDKCLVIHDNLLMQDFSPKLLDKLMQKLVKHPRKKNAQFSDQAKIHFSKLSLWVDKNLLPITQFGKLPDPAPYGDLITYLGLMAISCIAYFALSWIIAPFAIVAPNLIAFTTSLLFYSIGLAPLWYFLKNQWHIVRDYCHHIISLPLKTKMVEGLNVLKETELLILNVLAPSVVDLQSYDIASLTKELNHIQNQLLDYQQKLGRYNRIRWVGNEFIHPDLLISKLAKQTNYLHKTIGNFIDHIIANLANEIDTLCDDPAKNTLVPCFSKKQIHDYSAFVETFGTPEQCQHFKSVTDVTQRWFDAYANLTMIEKEKDSSIKESWGGYKIRTDYLNGWQILLDTFIQDKAVKKACLSVNQCLAGKTESNMVSLQHAVQLINKKQAPLWLRKIQNIIMLTLNQRSPRDAQLLSEKQKKQCLSWYKNHQKPIHNAITQFQNWLDNMNNPNREITIARAQMDTVFQYIHGAQIGDNCQAKPKERFLPGIRQALNAYNGQYSWPFRLIYFLPLDLQPKYTLHLGQKRVDWLMNHMAESHNPFNRIDTELFHKLDISDLIRNHPLFDEDKGKTMFRFLKVCHQQGFDDGSLLKLYRKQHGQEICQTSQKAAPTPLRRQSLCRIANAG